MKFIKNMKIHNKLLISYLLACIIPLLLSSQVIYRYSVITLEESLLEMITIFNSQVISGIDNFITEYDNITKTILVDQEIVTQNNLGSSSSMIAKVDNQLAVKKILLRLETLKPEIDRIMLLTSTNELFQYGKTNDTIDLELLKSQDWFQNLINSERLLNVTPLHDTSYYLRDKDRTIISVGRIILDSGGKYFGILIMDLRSVQLIQLNDEFLQARNNYNIKLTVTNEYGHVLYDSDAFDGKTSSKDVIDSPYVQTEQKSEDYIILSEKSKFGDLVVHTEIPRSDLLFKVRKIQYITIFATVFCSLAVICVSIIFSRSITKPIKRLQKSMKSAEGGKYTAIIEYDSTDEIGDLIKNYNQMIRKTKSLIEDVYLADIKQKNARLLALQSQINPHMLYNTLESIRMKALMNSDNETAEMIKILSRLFRTSLGQDNAQNNIQSEISYLENYLTLQNIRFDNRFKLQVFVSDEVRNSHIITLILQPLVENCIKHGHIGNKTSLGITITGKITESNDILLTISDDGIGIQESKIETINKNLSPHNSTIASLSISSDMQSIGLKNIAERIFLHYGAKYYIKIISGTTEGTSVEILIPNLQS